jgi:hypothetical protein
MYDLGELRMIREHRDELLREAEKRRLASRAHRKEPHHRGHIRAALRVWRRKTTSLSSWQAR